mgnify:CR=1 FL=1
MKRRLSFALVLFLFVAGDMLSTYLVVGQHNSDFDENSPLIDYLLILNPLLLAVWAVVLPALLYLFYPALEKQNLHIHLEVLALLFIINTCNAVINNFQLLLHY